MPACVCMKRETGKQAGREKGKRHGDTEENLTVTERRRRKLSTIREHCCVSSNSINKQVRLTAILFRCLHTSFLKI